MRRVTVNQIMWALWFVMMLAALMALNKPHRIVDVRDCYASDGGERPDTQACVFDYVHPVLH